MKLLLVTIFVGSLFFYNPLHAEIDGKSLTAKDFLYTVRRNHPENTWGILQGSISQRRRFTENGKVTYSSHEAPIKLGIRFTKTRILAQIVLGDNEIYSIGQSYNETPTSIIKLGSAKYRSELADFGLRPEDITMTFIYWNLEKELPKTSIKGQACRVFELSGPKGKEKVIVYLSEDYFSPLKAEWIKNGEEKPYRTLTVNAFEKVNDLWTYSDFTLYGPGWRTKVNFSSINLGYVKDGIPENLFI